MKRTTLTVGAITALTAAVAVLVWWHGPAPAPATTTGAPVHTVKVIRTDLASTLTEPGTLGYGAEREVKGPAAGRVTWLPASGTTVGRGQPLARVDDRPVTLFLGDTPLFRPLDTPGLVGRDVKVVADNLRALGFDIGAQPRVGTQVRPSPSTPARKVEAGDGVLTAALVTAVMRWQTAAGQAPSGVIGAGDVLVEPGPVRVATVRAQLGDDATGTLFTVTATSKQVSVEANAFDAGAVHPGDHVSASLPDGTSAPATVTGVSRFAQSGADPGADPATATKVVISITVDDPARIAGFDAGNVQVEFTAAVRKGVLAVPVGALLAVRNGGYAVQVEGGPLVAVTTGLFAQGLVEITGTGIDAGTTVVTTS